MGEAITVFRVIENVGAASATVLVAVALWYLFSGRAPTPREYQRAEALAERERERAARKEEEARLAHERLDRLAATLPEMADLMESIDRRLDLHGYPKCPQKRRAWPWERTWRK